MNHDDRRAAVQGFKSEKSALLFCTGIAAKGSDLPKVRCIIQYDSPGKASAYVHRVGRTARLGEKGEALLFLQPVEIDYLHDLQRHGVSLKEYPREKVLESFPFHGQKQSRKNLVTIEMHPWVLFLQQGIGSFISAESRMRKLAQDAFCSWVRLEEDFCGQEAPLRACSKEEFRIKRSTFWEIVPDAGEEEEERSGACQVIQKEEAGHKRQMTTKDAKIWVLQT